MKTKFLIFSLAWVMLATYAHAQETTFLSVLYTSSTGSATTDNFSFEGGEIVIQDNAVTVVFSDAALNKTYNFDEVTSFTFTTQPGPGTDPDPDEPGPGTAVAKAGTAQKPAAYIDPSGVLHVWNVSGVIRIYNVAGSLVASGKIEDAATTGINLSQLPNGVYIIQSEKGNIKVVKQF
jgi:hypothetical protein